MTKRFIFTIMAILTMATTVSCKEETKTETDDHFITIDEAWDDGWSGKNVQTWDKVDKQVEETHILTERIITERIITEQIIVETTVVESIETETVYVSPEYLAEVEYNSKKNVYFGEE